MENSLDMVAVLLVTIAAILAVALLVLYEVRVGLRLFREIRSLLRELRDQGGSALRSRQAGRR